MDKEIKITMVTSVEHGYKCGDVISITQPENRWWMKTLNFILRKPQFRQVYMVIKQSSKSTITV